MPSTSMKFDIVRDELRKEVLPARNVQSEWMKALIAGKTIRIAKEDRDRIGGNVATLRKRGLRLRTGAISETDVLAWTERIGPERD